MPIYIPQPDFSQAVNNSSATVTSTGSPGTSVTPGTSNAVGTAVSLLSAIDFDCEMMVISCQGVSVVGAADRGLMDILYDPAGGTSWSVLIPNLLCGSTNTAGTGGGWCRTYRFPIWVPSGSSIGCQIRSSNATASSAVVFVQVFGGIRNPASWWCGQKVIDIGTATGTSAGQSHTAGSSGAYSAWTSLGSALTYDGGAVQLAVQNGQSAATAIAYYYELGISSTAITPPVYIVFNTSEVSAMDVPGPFFVSIPNGSQLQIRGTASGVAQAHDVAAYVVV